MYFVETNERNKLIHKTWRFQGVTIDAVSFHRFYITMSYNRLFRTTFHTGHSTIQLLSSKIFTINQVRIDHFSCIKWKFNLLQMFLSNEVTDLWMALVTSSLNETTLVALSFIIFSTPRESIVRPQKVTIELSTVWALSLRSTFFRLHRRLSSSLIQSSAALAISPTGQSNSISNVWSQPSFVRYWFPFSVFDFW